MLLCCFVAFIHTSIALYYLTVFNSPKYSSKPIVRVIKKQYLCTQKTKRKSIKILLQAHEKKFLARKTKKEV